MAGTRHGDDPSAVGWGETGPNPTDRAKCGTKRSLLTDGGGVPLAVAIAGANRPDFQLARETLENVNVDQPEPTPKEPQGLSMDKGYDFDEVRELAAEFCYTTHMPRHGEEATALQREAGKKACRWVVERTHSWLNRFRRILVRWEKKPQNYLAMLHLACAVITFRAAGLLG